MVYFHCFDISFEELQNVGMNVCSYCDGLLRMIPTVRDYISFDELLDMDPQDLQDIFTTIFKHGDYFIQNIVHSDDYIANLVIEKNDNLIGIH